MAPVTQAITQTGKSYSAPWGKPTSLHSDGLGRFPTCVFPLDGELLAKSS